MARFIYIIEFHSMDLSRQATNEKDARRLAIDLCSKYHRPVFISRYLCNKAGLDSLRDLSYDAWTEYTFCCEVKFYKI